MIYTVPSAPDVRRAWVLGELLENSLIAMLCFLVLMPINAEYRPAVDYAAMVWLVISLLMLEIALFFWSRKVFCLRYRTITIASTALVSAGSVIFANPGSFIALFVFVMLFIGMGAIHLWLCMLRNGLWYALLQTLLMCLSWLMYRAVTEYVPAMEFLIPLRNYLVYTHHIISATIFNATFLGLVVGTLTVVLSTRAR